MKYFFKALCWFTILFGLGKLAFSIYGLLNTDRIATFIMMGVGADSAAHSGVLAKNLGATTVPFLWGLLVSSVLLTIAGWVMSKGKRWGFYLHALTSALLVIFFFYAGFNFFPVMGYLTVLPLLGSLLYVTVLQYFWFNKPRA